MKTQVICYFCHKPFKTNSHNAIYCPKPKDCKAQEQRSKKMKHEEELRARIQQVIDGKLSINVLKTTSLQDKKIIRAAFNRAGFIR